MGYNNSWKSKSKAKPKSRPKRNYKKKVSTRTLTRLVSVEKKVFNKPYSSTDTAFGQVNGNLNGFFAYAITPTPTQGTTSSSRIGNKISLRSGYMTLQIRQQSACISPVNVDLYFVEWKNYKGSLAAGDIPLYMFNINGYIGGGAAIEDKNSSLNVNIRNDYIIHRKVTCRIQPDSISGQQMLYTRKIGFKFKKPLSIRFEQDGNNTVSQGNMYLIAMCDSGNASTVNACTLSNVPVTAVNTGLFMNFNIDWYYTDN